MGQDYPLFSESDEFLQYPRDIPPDISGIPDTSIDMIHHDNKELCETNEGTLTTGHPSVLLQTIFLKKNVSLSVSVSLVVHTLQVGYCVV